MPLALNELERAKFYRVVEPVEATGSIVVSPDDGSLPVVIYTTYTNCRLGGKVSNTGYRFEPVNFQFDGLTPPTAPVTAPGAPGSVVTKADFLAAVNGYGPMVEYKSSNRSASPTDWTPVTVRGNLALTKWRHDPTFWESYERWYKFRFATGVA